MIKYIVTHGARLNGVNPRHTQEGLAQIASLRIPTDIKCVIVGTGKRFWEVFQTLSEKNPIAPDAPVLVSPFCGSADAFTPPSTIVLTSGMEVPLKSYIGINNTDRFDAFGWVSDQPEGTLFIAGAEFLVALGLEKPSKGALYALNDVDKTVTLIQQG